MEGQKNKGENSGEGGANNPAVNAAAWESLLGSENSIKENYQDDVDYIEHKKQYGYGAEAKAQDKATRKEVRDAELDELRAYQDRLQQINNRTAQDYNNQHFNDFVGETNIDSETGKKRTRSSSDLYHRQSNETKAEYSERIKTNADLTTLAEFAPKYASEDTKQYNDRLKDLHTDFPRQAGETPSDYKKRIADANENNQLLFSIANHTIDPQSPAAKYLSDELNNIEDMYKNKTFDAAHRKAYQREVLQKAIEEQLNQKQPIASDPEAKAKLDAEAKAKHEAEAKAKLIEEAKAKLDANERRKAELLAEAKQLLTENEQAKARLEAELPKLVAINADFLHDKKELAHDYAERELNAENAKSGLLKRIWKGNLFKKYYEKKYEREILSGQREVTAEDGSKKNLDEIIKERSESAITRFTLAATEEYGKEYIHTKERMSEADKRTTKIVKSAIEKFAKAKIPEDGDLDKFKREFGNDIRELVATSKDQKQPINEALINNYFEVAKQARMRAEHGIAIERVMDGFKVYNAEVRNNVRTAAHRDNIDKIVNKLESSAFGSVVPPEIVAGALGTVVALTQTGARVLAGAAGGIGVASIAAGLRERNRVTEDRARKMRDLAFGLGYNSGDANHVARKSSKYETRIGGTLYDTRSAMELTKCITGAAKSGNRQFLLQAIAEARVRIDFSDSEQKDLISYSSADRLGDERTGLDIAVIEAEHSLSAEDKRTLENMKKTIQKQITENVVSQDASFRRLRTAQAIKQAGKTLVLGAAFFVGSQEAIAAFDPNKIGILEKAGIIKTNNNSEAAETLLARIAPGRRVESYTSDPIRLRGDERARMRRLEEAGYTRNEVSPAHTETVTDVAEVSPAKSSHALNVETRFADNGTASATGNELGLHLENGNYVAKMSGNSTLGSETFNYEQLASAGRIKGHISIGGGTFEVQSTVNSAGQIVWPVDANGNITTTTGETIRAFGEGGEKLFKSFRVVADNGIDANGVKQVVSLAADAGSDSFTGTIQEVVERTIEEPAIYEYTKTILTESPAPSLFTGGVVPPVFTSRVGLGEARQSAIPSTENIPLPEDVRALFNNRSTGEASGNTTSTTGGGRPTQSAQPAPSQPVQPAPSQPAPSQPVQPTPTQPAPSQPVQPTPTQPAPAPARPVQPTPASQPAPAQPAQPAPAQSPQPTNNPNTSSDPGINGIRTAFLDLAGEDGVRFMTDTDSYTEGKGDAMANWWANLSDEAKEEIVGYEQSFGRNSNLGGALRVWLSMQGYNF